MRKVAAILFLLLLAFNLIGYRFWFYYEQQKASAQLIASLDKEEYEAEDLISITVPLSLPYQTDWDHFERVDGRINVNGKTYHFVKRKVTNGNMVLLCLPDHIKPKMETARDEFFKLANLFQANAPTEKSSPSVPVSLKSIISDFDQESICWSLQDYKGKASYHLFPGSTPLRHTFITAPDQPPEAGS